MKKPEKKLAIEAALKETLTAKGLAQDQVEGVSIQEQSDHFFQ